MERFIWEYLTKKYRSSMGTPKRLPRPEKPDGPYKWCAKGQHWVATSNFQANKHNKDGLQWYCRVHQTQAVKDGKNFR